MSTTRMAMRSKSGTSKAGRKVRLALEDMAAHRTGIVHGEQRAERAALVASGAALSRDGKELRAERRWSVRSHGRRIRLTMASVSLSHPAPGVQSAPRGSPGPPL